MYKMTLFIKVDLEMDWPIFCQTEQGMANLGNALVISVYNITAYIVKMLILDIYLF